MNTIVFSFFLARLKVLDSIVVMALQIQQMVLSIWLIRYFILPYLMMHEVIIN